MYTPVIKKALIVVFLFSAFLSCKPQSPKQVKVVFSKAKNDHSNVSEENGPHFTVMYRPEISEKGTVTVTYGSVTFKKMVIDDFIKLRDSLY